MADKTVPPRAPRANRSRRSQMADDAFPSGVSSGAQVKGNVAMNMHTAITPTVTSIAIGGRRNCFTKLHARYIRARARQVRALDQSRAAQTSEADDRFDEAVSASFKAMFTLVQQPAATLEEFVDQFAAAHQETEGELDKQISDLLLDSLLRIARSS